VEVSEISQNIRLPPSARAAIPGTLSTYEGRTQDRRYKPTSARGASVYNFEYGRTRRIDIIRANRAAQAAAQVPLPFGPEDIDMHDEL